MNINKGILRMKLLKTVKKGYKKTYYFMGVKVFQSQSNTKMLKSIMNIEESLERIEKKLSMKDDTWQIGNTKVFVPRYPADFIQKHIVDKNEFFEQDILERLDLYIPDNATILDIGANIGNHTLYWSRRALSIYSFEPVKETFDILNKNISINSLENKVNLFNIGLSDKSSKAIFNRFIADNIGANSVSHSEEGDMKLEALDNMDINFNKIDFVKIDVENHEEFALLGMGKTLKKYKPIVFIEVQKENFEKINNILNSYGFKVHEEFPHQNYLYKFEK